MSTLGRSLLSYAYCKKASVTEKTFFGLAVVTVDGAKFVRVDDIKALPFFDFWSASSAGSTMRQAGGQKLVFLHDWEAFSQIFIRTGRHRFQAS